MSNLHPVFENILNGVSMVSFSEQINPIENPLTTSERIEALNRQNITELIEYFTVDKFKELKKHVIQEIIDNNLDKENL